MSAQFKLVPIPDGIALRGVDDDGDPFNVSLDRVWAGNLVQELDDWLSGGRTERELRRVDL